LEHRPVLEQPAMATTYPNQKRSTDRVTHSKEYALDEREFELLLEACHRLSGDFETQCRFVVMVAGRLGLRGGEIAHMKRGWVDFREKMIRIPAHEECEKGRDGGHCAYCRRMAAQKADVHNRQLYAEAHETMPTRNELAPAALADEVADEVTAEDMLSTMWSPKTSSAVREVPFDFSVRVEMAVERFFDRYDEFPCSRQVVNRRVNRAARAADELGEGDVFPHSLRATAATAHASKGLSTLGLQSLLGWADLQTAQVYISQTGRNTARELREIHSR